MKEETTVSSAEMKEIERIADGNGLTYRQMMENAGTAAYEVIRQRWPDAERIVIFAGKGNNGGDGFVVARLYASFLSGRENEEDSVDGKWKERRERPKQDSRAQAGFVVVLCEGAPVTEDADYNLGLLRGRQTAHLAVMRLEEYEKAAQTAADSGLFSGENSSGTVSSAGGDERHAHVSGVQADLIVDALYGTGFHGALRENGTAAAALINASRAPVCALDLPSGVNADTGEVARGAVRADLTVAFHRKKHGHRSLEAASYCGEIVTVGIGIDEIGGKPVF